MTTRRNILEGDVSELLTTAIIMTRAVSTVERSSVYFYKTTWRNLPGSDVSELLFTSINLMMEAVSNFETPSVYFYEITRRNVIEGSHVHYVYCLLTDG
jgi:hypothetical protein